jgi:S-adenosylmethionine-diacylglycerol 3-amino-3-carboxypropyl transferase
VREDALLDEWVLRRFCPPAARVILVASGGCTAAYLAASGRVAHLHLVDLNPAQIALARWKLDLLQTADAGRRMALLGHAPMPPGERAAALADGLRNLGLPPDTLSPLEFVAEVGPDHAGRYERLFAQLRQELAPVAGEVEALLKLSDLSESARRAAPDTPLGRALDEAFDVVMALPNLVRLFGEMATRNRVEPFSRHFARRTRHALATLPAADNPYLWQLLRGRFPDGVSYPWLTATPPYRMLKVTWTVSGMTEALAAVPAGFDFVHLSNILDWLSPEEARHTLGLAAAALRPGGCVFVRQLNSTVDVRGSGAGIDWDASASAELHASDRSFFYRDLHLGRKS